MFVLACSTLVIFDEILNYEIWNYVLEINIFNDKQNYTTDVMKTLG